MQHWQYRLLSANHSANKKRKKEKKKENTQRHREGFVYIYIKKIQERRKRK
jgi:hypothetical protein